MIRIVSWKWRLLGSCFFYSTIVAAWFAHLLTWSSLCYLVFVLPMLFVVLVVKLVQHGAVGGTFFQVMKPFCGCRRCSGCGRRCGRRRSRSQRWSFWKRCFEASLLIIRTRIYPKEWWVHLCPLLDFLPCKRTFRSAAFQPWLWQASLWSEKQLTLF